MSVFGLCAGRISRTVESWKKNSLAGRLGKYVIACSGCRCAIAKMIRLAIVQRSVAVLCIGAIADVAYECGDVNMGAVDVQEKGVGAEEEVVDVEGEVANVGEEVLDVGEEVVNVEEQVVGVEKEIVDANEEVVDVGGSSTLEKTPTLVREASTSRKTA